jgi:phage internal scaffolding protein
MTKSNVRNAFSRKRVSFATTGESLTLQAMKDECDVNRILAKYRKTGAAEFLNRYQGDYGDFVSAPDFEEAQNAVAKALSMFEELPSGVRARFSNSPSEFLAFAQEPSNIAEMRSMGLAKPERAPEVAETPSPIAEGGSATDPAPSAPESTVSPTT